MHNKTLPTLNNNKIHCTLLYFWMRVKRASVGTEDREMSHVLSGTGWAGFTMLLRMERNLKLMNCLFLEFSI
jgi:hypothetical protein